MDTYEQCLTTENDGGFFNNFFMLVFIFGFSATIASIFVVEYVWKPMIMSEEEIKEIELELENANKDIPYEERYPISDYSDFADYEDGSDSSDSSESSDSESESESESKSESESESELIKNLSEEGEVRTDDEELIFEMERSEESDDISSGELIEKPSDNDDSQTQSKSEKDVSDKKVNKLALLL